MPILHEVSTTVLAAVISVGIMRPVLCSAGTWEKLLSDSVGLRSIKGRRNNRFSSIIIASIYETVLKTELVMQEGVVRSVDA